MSKGTKIRPIRMSPEFFAAASRLADIHGHSNLTAFLRALIIKSAYETGVEIPEK